MHQNTSNKKKADRPGSLEDHYLEEIKLAPGVQALIGEKGTYVKGSVKSTSDYSYHATGYSGDHFRIVGDAGGDLFDSPIIRILTGNSVRGSFILFRRACGHDWSTVGGEHYPWFDERPGIGDRSAGLA